MMSFARMNRHLWTNSLLEKGAQYVGVRATFLSARFIKSMHETEKYC